MVIVVRCDHHLLGTSCVLVRVRAASTCACFLEVFGLGRMDEIESELSRACACSTCTRAHVRVRVRVGVAYAQL